MGAEIVAHKEERHVQKARRQKVLLISHKLKNVLRLHMLSVSLRNTSNTLQHDETSDRAI
jgi:hypothetical protein